MLVRSAGVRFVIIILFIQDLGGVDKSGNKNLEHRSTSSGIGHDHAIREICTTSGGIVHELIRPRISITSTYSVIVSERRRAHTT